MAPCFIMYLTTTPYCDFGGDKRLDELYYSSVVTSTSFRLNVVSVPLPLCTADRPNSFFSLNVTFSLVGLTTAAVTATAADDGTSPAGSNATFVRPKVLVPFALVRPTLDVLAVVAASELTGLCPSAGAKKKNANAPLLQSGVRV